MIACAHENANDIPAVTARIPTTRGVKSLQKQLQLLPAQTG